MNKKIVLDTNILLVSIPNKSKYRLIFDKLIKREFDLIISNEILSEYAEILERKTNTIVAKNICELLLSLSNVKRVEIYYKWNLIESDPDDNKFCDTALAANADFLVTNDHHFNNLAEVDFPKLAVIDLDHFLEELKKY